MFGFAAASTNEQQLSRIHCHRLVLSITDLLHPKSGGCVVKSKQKIFVYQINGYRKGCEICQPFVSRNKQQQKQEFIVDSLPELYNKTNTYKYIYNMFGEIA